jgi:hypothetical protein
MSKVRRNQACPCGSGVKAKRCCGVQPAPTEGDLAKAELSRLRLESMSALRLKSTADMVGLYKEVARLPRLDLSLQQRLPTFLPPELERFNRALFGDDREELLDSLEGALSSVDTPTLRLELAQAVVALREANRITDQVAAAALVDLDSEATCMVRESLVAALALRCGESRTPAGLLLAG